MNPFRRRQQEVEQEVVRPNIVITEVPRTLGGVQMPPDIIMIRYNEDGSVSERRRIDFQESEMLLESGEAFTAPKDLVDGLSSGRMSFDDLYNAVIEQELEPVADVQIEEPEAPQGRIDRLRETLPFGGERRMRDIDAKVEGNL